MADNLKKYKTKLMARLDIDRQLELEPKRMEYAIKEILDYTEWLKKTKLTKRSDVLKEDPIVLVNTYRIYKAAIKSFKK